MAAIYEKAFGGYIADVPRMWFKRCDGRIFYFDELTNATVTPQINYTEVNAGWSLYPVAYLPGQSTFEMQITSGKFDADLFVMTNSTQFATNATYQMPATETYTLTQAGTCTLVNTPVANSVSITGFHETNSTPAAGSGEYKIEGKVLTFAPEDVDGQITISYMYETTAQEANIDNRSSAIGEAVLVYPVPLMRCRFMQ